MNDWEAFGLIALAGLLGALLGFEREIKEKAAGVRTHLLVSSSAAAIVVSGGFSTSRRYPTAKPPATPPVPCTRSSPASGSSERVRS